MNKAKLVEIVAGLLGIFLKKKQTAPAPVVVQPAPQPIAPQSEINWADLSAKITPRFTVKEATWLNSWGVAHQPSEDQKKAIVAIALAVGKAADILEKKLGRKVAIHVHAWMRPEVADCPGTQWHGKDYNRYIYETQVWKGLTDAEKAAKKVPKSPHRTGHAIDFHVGGFEGAQACAKIREMLLPHLEELGLRMENINGGWVHLDDLPVVNQRFFKP